MASKLSFRAVLILPMMLSSIAVAATPSADSPGTPPASILTAAQRDYVEQVAAAETETDPFKRCLAVPGAPEFHWSPQLVEWACSRFLPAPLTMAEIRRLVQDKPEVRVDQILRERLRPETAIGKDCEPVLRTFRQFDASPDSIAVADQWVARVPDSAYAHTAKAYSLIAQGWAARGNEYTQKTSPAKLHRLEEFLISASAELHMAVTDDPDLLPAYLGLLEIDRILGDAIPGVDGQALVEHALQRDPTCYSLRDELMTRAEPRWGGSDQAMMAEAARADPYVRDTPALAVLVSYPIGYEAYVATIGNRYEGVLPPLRQALAHAPDSGFLLAAAEGAEADKDDWSTFVYFTQYLRLAESPAWARNRRAYAAARMRERNFAEAEFRRGIAENPRDGSALYALGMLCQETGRMDEAVGYFQRSSEIVGTRKLALIALEHLLWERTHDYEVVGPLLEKIVNEFPEYGRAWFFYGQMLQARHDPKFVEAYKTFVRLANRNDAFENSMAERIEAILASQGATK